MFVILRPENLSKERLIQKAQNVVDYTNMRLVNWYVNVWEDYGVKGEAECKYDAENNRIIIEWKEDGDKGTYVNSFWYDDEVAGIEYVFNIWMENPHHQN